MKTRMEKFFSALVLLPTGDEYVAFIKDTIQNYPKFLENSATSMWCAKCSG